jgi:hypothetical protein
VLCVRSRPHTTHKALLPPSPQRRAPAPLAWRCAAAHRPTRAPPAGSRARLLTHGATRRTPPARGGANLCTTATGTGAARVLGPPRPLVSGHRAAPASARGSRATLRARAPDPPAIQSGRAAAQRYRSEEQPPCCARAASTTCAAAGPPGPSAEPASARRSRAAAARPRAPPRGRARPDQSSAGRLPKRIASMMRRARRRPRPARGTPRGGPSSGAPAGAGGRALLSTGPRGPRPVHGGQPKS